MEIQEMRATFGKLQDQTLSLKPGLNCIYAPNESGKSTWSHFLRIMLYGLSTRERGDLADKNRFAPWSGAAMRGQLQVADGNGTSLTLSRDTRRANAPMGQFACTYTGTATAVPGIDGQNAGETLLGVPARCLSAAPSSDKARWRWTAMQSWSAASPPSSPPVRRTFPTPRCRSG